MLTEHLLDKDFGDEPPPLSALELTTSQSVVSGFSRMQTLSPRCVEVSQVLDDLSYRNSAVDTALGLDTASASFIEQLLNEDLLASDTDSERHWVDGNDGSSESLKSEESEVLKVVKSGKSAKERVSTVHAFESASTRQSQAASKKQKEGLQRQTAVANLESVAATYTDPASSAFLRDRYPEVAAARKRKTILTAIKIALLVSITTAVVIYEYMYLNDNSRNTITTSKFMEVDEVRTPIWLIAWMKKDMNCTVEMVVDTNASLGHESQNAFPVRHIRDHRQFVYDQNFTHWAQVGYYDSQLVSGLDLVASLIVPPFGHSIQNEMSWAFIPVCTLINETHNHPSDNSEYNLTEHPSYRPLTYWDDITQLTANGWYNLFVGPLADEKFRAENYNGTYTSSHLFERMVNGRHSVASVDLSTIAVISLREVNLLNEIKHTKRRFYEFTVDANKRWTQLTEYFPANMSWVLTSHLWFAPQSDNLLLKVKTTHRRTLFDTIATIGGFMEPITKGVNILFTLIIGGVAIGALSVRGVAEDAPLPEATERKVHKFLKRFDVINRDEVKEEILEMLKSYELVATDAKTDIKSEIWTGD